MAGKKGVANCIFYAAVLAAPRVVLRCGLPGLWHAGGLPTPRSAAPTPRAAVPAAGSAAGEGSGAAAGGPTAMETDAPAAAAGDGGAEEPLAKRRRRAPVDYAALNAQMDKEKAEAAAAAGAAAAAAPDAASGDAAPTAGV